MARTSLKSPGKDLIGPDLIGPGLLSAPASKDEQPPEVRPASVPARKEEPQLQERQRQLFQSGDAFNLFFPLEFDLNRPVS